MYMFFFLVLIVLDQLSKYWALSFGSFFPYPIMPFLNCSLSINRGITFGMLWGEGASWQLALASGILIVLAVFYVHIRHRAQRNLSIVPEILVLAGGSSNLIDRAVYGGVIDFIDICYGSWHWHTFNFADLFIVVGIVWMLVREIFD